jgi:hypothetical protein
MVAHAVDRSALLMSARRAFLRGLIDDAGLFPPASLGMREALEADAAARASPESWMLGRFIAPASRLTELLPVLPPGGAPLRVSAIVDGANVAHDLERTIACAGEAPSSVAIDAVELKIPGVPDGDVPRTVLCIVADIDASGLPAGTPAYLEISFGADWRAHVATTFDAIADARLRSPHDIAVKIRCGGPTADAAPTPEQLAVTIGRLRALGIPFKATAGLHHPVRHHNRQAGLVMHGFLNVVGVAVLDHALDLDERTRHRMLADHHATNFALDDVAFAWSGLRADESHVAEARRDFVRSFGSCSFSEPVADLIALGILEPVAS